MNQKKHLSFTPFRRKLSEVFTQITDWRQEKKVEIIHQLQFKTREEAKLTIFEYIEVFYNRLRMHSANDYLSPAEYEKIQNYF